jgi:hypothetical protein
MLIKWTRPLVKSRKAARKFILSFALHTPQRHHNNNNNNNNNKTNNNTNINTTANTNTTHIINQHLSSSSSCPTVACLPSGSPGLNSCATTTIAQTINNNNNNNNSHHVSTTTTASTMLPVTTPRVPSSIALDASGSSSTPALATLTEYLYRMVHYPQMDLDYTFYQMFHLCFSPSRAYVALPISHRTTDPLNASM